MPCPGASAATSWAIRLFPMPASPATRTIAPCPAAARRSVAAAMSISRSRPTNGRATARASRDPRSEASGARGPSVEVIPIPSEPARYRSQPASEPQALRLRARGDAATGLQAVAAAALGPEGQLDRKAVGVAEEDRDLPPADLDQRVRQDRPARRRDRLGRALDVRNADRDVREPEVAHVARDRRGARRPEDEELQAKAVALDEHVVERRAGQAQQGVENGALVVALGVPDRAFEPEGGPEPERALEVRHAHSDVGHTSGQRHRATSARPAAQCGCGRAPFTAIAP